MVKIEIDDRLWGEFMLQSSKLKMSALKRVKDFIIISVENDRGLK